MATRTGSIDLGVSRVIGLISPLDGNFAIQMLSSDISASTTFSLEVSLDGTNWDVAQEAGTDITDTLVQSETKVKIVETADKLYFRVIFAGATTGNVSYVITV